MKRPTNEQALLYGGLTLISSIVSLMTALATDARWAAVMMGACYVYAMVETISARRAESRWRKSDQSTTPP